MPRWCCAALVVLAPALALGADPPRFGPGARVLLDAHNAYPEAGRWADRIDRALALGRPLAIEQDLVWCQRPDGRWESVVGHDAPCRGDEPSFLSHFIARIRPMLTAGDLEQRRGDWPLITLNLDFKTNEPAHHEAVWQLLGTLDPWLTTAPRTDTPARRAPLTAGPLLVLTGSDDGQAEAFHDRVTVGQRLRVFGAVGDRPGPEPADDPSRPLPHPGAPSNYRRWWNHPWEVVEAGGPPGAGRWTRADNERLRALVSRAHAQGLWLRLYTLNGHSTDRGHGWNAKYNFGSVEAARARWDAAIRAGVDFVATDQYEDLAARRRPDRRDTGL